MTRMNVAGRRIAMVAKKPLDHCCKSTGGTEALMRSKDAVAQACGRGQINDSPTESGETGSPRSACLWDLGDQSPMSIRVALKS